MIKNTRKKLMSDDKTGHTRRVLLLAPHPLQTGKIKGQRAALETLYNARSAINDTISEVLECLEECTGVMFPRLKLDIRRKTSAGVSPADVLMTLDRSDEYRAVGDFSGNAPYTMKHGVTLPCFKMSHFVVCACDLKDDGWTCADPSGVVAVTTDVHKLRHLIVDILLDVAMFYSWPCLKEKYGGDLESRTRFSKVKAEFARQLRPRSYYGPIGRNLGYCSVASCIRKAEIFTRVDCINYERAWQDLVASCQLGPGRKGAPIVVDELLRKHRRGGQISAAKLQAHIGTLPSGDYVLILAASQPARSEDSKRVASMFGQPKWRTNMWRIVRYEQCMPFLRSYPSVTFYRFRHTASQMH